MAEGYICKVLDLPLFVVQTTTLFVGDGLIAQLPMSKSTSNLGPKVTFY